MKAVKIVAVLLVAAMLMIFVRAGDRSPLPQALPGCDGLPVSPTYLAGGFALLLLLTWGLARLAHRNGPWDGDA